MKKYFTNHYSQMQGIDYNSDESMLEWYKKVLPIYKVELSPYFEYLQNKSVLEIGCGIGGILNYFKQIDHNRYFGVDQSDEQIEMCKKFVTDKVIKMEASEFLINSNVKYDFIIMFDLIEHIEKDKIIPLLRLALKVLNKNGKILIRTPNMGSLTASYSRYIDFTHEVGFTAESLSQVLNEAGFKVMQCSNNAIGKKRLIILNCIHWLISKLYVFKKSQVVSANILVLAEK